MKKKKRFFPLVWVIFCYNKLINSAIVFKITNRSNIIFQEFTPLVCYSLDAVIKRSKKKDYHVNYTKRRFQITGTFF